MLKSKLNLELKGKVINVELPLVAAVRQISPSPKVENLEDVIFNELKPWLENNNLEIKGKRIAITAGSRGISGIPEILRSIVRLLKDYGADPFILPSMGSHGGAVAEGQLKILDSLGITEKYIEAPIISSLEVIQLGITEHGSPVWVDKVAAEAQGIIIVNRIKPHTDFSGEIESGLLKMAAIGLGNYKGATIVHNQALRQGYALVIAETGKKIIEKLPVLFGLAIIENCYDETARVELIPPRKIYDREKVILEEAKSLMMKIPFSKIDVLVIDEIGKNISGTGMDTNVVGRLMVYGQEEPTDPDVIRIVVLDLTKEAHGNGTGIGIADFTTEKVIGKIDKKSTYINSITACSPEKGRFPIALPTDYEAICFALQTAGLDRPKEAKLVHIKNTLQIREMEVSEALLSEVVANNNLVLLEDFHAMSFGENGDLKPISY